MEILYNTAILKNLVEWQAATNPTNDINVLEQFIVKKFNTELIGFVNTSPEHPISVHNKNINVLHPILMEKLTITQKLWEKYMKLKKSKTGADEEYFVLLEEMVSVVKRISNAYETDVLFNDPNIGSSTTILNVLKYLADISLEFLNDNNYIDNIECSDIVPSHDMQKYISNFNEIVFVESSKNGSFMSALDKETSYVHVKKEHPSIFDKYASTFHEIGHALYQVRVLNKNTLIGHIGQYVSLSLHESSSIFNEIVNAGIRKYVVSDNTRLYRLGSNKIHYIVHIYIRVLIEDMILNRGMDVREIPNKWNELMEQYLGIKPSNDWEGFLQDVHWNQGGFGYFHSYAIGFFNAVIMYQEVKDELSGDSIIDTEHVIKKITEKYGHFKEGDMDILLKIHTDIESSLAVYRKFIFDNYMKVVK